MLYGIKRPEHTVAHLQKEVPDHRAALDLIYNKYAPKSPAGKSFFRGAQRIHNMSVVDQHEFKKMIHVFGKESAKDCGWELIGWMPPTWFRAVESTNPNFTKDNTEFNKMLQRYPAFGAPVGLR